MQDFDLQESVCNATQYLSNVDENFDFTGNHGAECQRSLNYILGSLEMAHAFLHMGVILSQDMEDFVLDVLATAWVWCEDHDVVPTLEGVE